jgi:hypothetical protein
MPRKYKRKLGSRRYADYSYEKLELFLQAIKSGQMTQRRANELFNIPRRTLVYKLKKVHLGLPGPEECDGDPKRLQSFKEFKREKNAFVVVKYDNQLYPGVIIDVDDRGATVEAMCRSIKSWKWPQTKDINYQRVERHSWEHRFSETNFETWFFQR